MLFKNVIDSHLVYMINKGLNENKFSENAKKAFSEIYLQEKWLGQNWKL